MLLISGFGAHRLLRREAGLHVLELADDDGPARATARVRVVAAPLGELSPDKLRRALKDAFDRGGVPTARWCAATVATRPPGARHDGGLAQRPFRRGAAAETSISSPPRKPEGRILRNLVVAYNECAMMHRANATVFAVFCLAAVLGSSGLCAEELPDLVDRVQASVVSIAAEKTEASPPPQATGDKEQDDAAAKSNLRQGSGMVLSADGYIITATNLVDKVGKITVTFFDGKQAPRRSSAATRAPRSRF